METALKKDGGSEWDYLGTRPGLSWGQTVHREEAGDVDDWNQD